MIWRLRLKSRDEWLYVYLLLEFQSTPNDFMALRMLTYTCLLYEDLVKQKQFTPNGRLPPILPIVLYNGKIPWAKPEQIADLVDDPKGLSDYVPCFKYHLIDEGRLPTELLEPTDDPVAALFKLERAETKDDLLKGLESVLATTQDPKMGPLRDDLRKWLRRNILPIRYPGRTLTEVRNLLETPQMLAETIKTWPQKWLKQGQAQGKAEGKQSSIFEICSARGLVLSESQRRRIENTQDLDQLRDWLIKTAAADSVDEIFS